MKLYEWLALSLGGVLFQQLPALLIVVIFQVLICRKSNNTVLTLLLPCAGIIYLVYALIRYYQSVYMLIDVNHWYLWYGLLLIIPYSSYTVLTLITAYLFRKRKTRQVELQAMKIHDL